jgi:aldose 1-epimerase
MTAAYSIGSEHRGAVEVFTLRQGSDAYAEVAPALGNNCFTFQADAPVLEPVSFEAFRERPTSHGIPTLFPWPNRIRDGVFHFEGRRFEVQPNRHGFVRDKPWTVLATGASASEGAWITSAFESVNLPEQVSAQYPFPFRLDVTFRLREGVLSMETLVRNVGTTPMPCGFGIHPYFRRPESGAIRVPARKRWELVDSLPTGKVLDLVDPYDLLQPRSLDGLSLDDIYTDLIADPGGRVDCVLDDETSGLETVVEFDVAQFPHVVIFTPPEPKKAICIEPYTCPTDAFNLRERGVPSDVLVLSPEDSRSLQIHFHSRRAR